jgi:hypothetical protein
MRPLRWMLVGALSVPACFDEPRPATDAGVDAPVTDAGADPVDTVTPATDTGLPSIDRVSPLPDVTPPPPDAPLPADLPALLDAPDDAARDASVGPCTRDEDCADPLAPQCDLSRGRCVGCLPSADRCPPAQHCDGETNLCVPGCRSDEGCAVDGGARRCDTARHTCVECSDDGQCPANTLCTLGACVPGCNNARGCPSGQTCCDGTCHDITQDPAHCAMCGRGCSYRNAAPRCEFGTCAMGACNEPYADCDRATTNGCEVNTRTDPAHCGACNSRCEVGINATAASCVAGRCGLVCAENFADCDGDPRNGCEVDLRTDVRACGRCGVLCASAPDAPTITCAAGRCGYVCAAGRGDCDGERDNGCEVNTRTTVAHCGACGNACRSGPRSRPTCTAGRCVLQCDGGWGDCDGDPVNGCETELAGSVPHCGACGRACVIPGGTAACVAGQCTVAACGTVFRDCDRVSSNGCEADLRADAAHCGACDNRCAPAPNARPVCRDSACATECLTGFGDCDGSPTNGCERDLRTNATSCGACGRACSLPRATPSCVAGQCAVAACSAGYGDCDGIPSNGCETNLATSAANCGACGRRGVELCDGVDNDCDGVADEACPAGLTNLDTVTHTSATFGSRVGTAFDLNCPAGTVARGMSGRVSSYVTQIALQCATPRVVEDRASSPFRYTVALAAAATVGPAGVATGTLWSFSCPGNSVIGRIDGRVSGSVIYQVSFDCFDLAVEGAPSTGFTVSRAAAVSSSPLFGPSSGTAFTYDCPTSPGVSVLRGVFGTYYPLRVFYVSSLAARCVQPVVSVR